MRHRLHLVNKPEQHPYRQDHPLIRLTHRVKPDIITAGNICDTHLPFQIPQDLFCRLRRLLQHFNDLRTGQGSVLREPLDHILFIGQQHDNHLLLYSFVPKCVFRAKYALSISLLLPFLEDGFQLGTVSRDHFLFLFGRLNDDRHLTVVGTDQRLAAFKAGDGTDLGFRKLQRIPYKLRFVRLQIQNDLILELLIIARP